MEDIPLPSAVQDALHNLSMAYRRQMRAALHVQSLQLTPNELKVLLFVGYTPLCMHKDVVTHTGADKAQVARTLQQMEAAQWLERVPHPQDKRSRCLRLSPQGEAAFLSLRAHRRSLGTHMLDGIPEDQQQLLLNMLRHMYEQLAALPLPLAEGEPENPAQHCQNPASLHD